MSSDCQEMPPARTKMHDMLDGFVGTWDATTLFWFGPGEPHKSGGVMKSKWILQNAYLEQVYEGEAFMGRAFAGRGVWTYNAAIEKFEGMWYDTAVSMLQMETGSFDSTGKVYTAFSKFVSPHSGGTLMHKKTVITVKGPGEHVMEMFMGPTEDQLAKCMEITFRLRN